MNDITLGQMFGQYVIKPVLDKMDIAAGSKGSMNTESAVIIMLMIAAHESDCLKYSLQIKGPAISFLQMEPDTFNHNISWLKANRPQLMDVINQLSPIPNDYAFEMAMYPEFAIGMGRANLLRFPEKLPDASDLTGLAAYAKKYWNTYKGKATWGDYLKAYQRFMNIPAK
ncbi:hypothetical protein L4D77_18460 [Photobacterium frigidiphilum]|uniref:hypothetical protein n=1 Tax=Photobacterium frigidiphilum TaxID=264736 RepID=UPI003D1530B4